MPAGTENPADYYKNVAFSPTSVNGETKKPAGNASVGMGEFASEKTGKRAPEGDEACVEAKKPRLQDSSEPDDVKVPREVELFRFLGSRADEIASLVKDVERKYPKLISQQVPRHMRRRTVSHDKRRLPKRLQLKIAHEPDPPKSKRPSRKHRRRPRNLLAEYARRQRRHVWLETHIWHAKRFKMADLWGYRVPLHPTDKGIRAAYRGSAKHVLLHDLSYYNCIELIGNEETLVSKLTLLTNADAGLTFGAKSYLSGTREGTVVLYHRNCYPFGAIGPAKFLWRAPAGQNNSDTKNDRQLWLWVHPTIHGEVTEELVSVFELQRVQARTGVTADSKARDSDVSVEVPGERTSACDSKRVKFEKSSPELKAEGTNCSATDETTKLVRPSAQSTISADEAKLKTEKQTSETQEGQKRTSTKNCAESSKRKKLKERKASSRVADNKKDPEKDEASMAEVVQLPVYTNGSVTMVQLKEQMVRFSLTGPLATGVVLNALVPSREASSPETEAWWNKRAEENQAQEVGWEMVQAEDAECEQTLLPRVLGRTVRDPRILLPACKTKVTGHCPPDKCTELPLVPQASDSALWDPLLRDAVSSQKVPEAELNRLRSQNPKPGTLLDLGDAESRIPVVAIRKDGSRTNLGFGSGWDLILPAGWGRPFWIALVYRGARASGLRELRSLSLEMGVPCFPFDHPDTAATQQSEEENRRELMTKHLRYPPDKRPSFQKLRISCPFFFPWSQLVQEWRTLDQPSADNAGCDDGSTFYVLRSRKVLRRLAAMFADANKKRKKITLSAAAASKQLDDIRITAKAVNLDLSRALVCVELTSCSRGVLKRFDSISMPTAEDILALKNSGSADSVEAPCESLRRLKKPKDAKAKKKKAPRPTVEELLARPTVSSVVKSCSRLLLGGVVSGDYCFSSACGRGLGYCAFEGLVHLIETSASASVRPLVLFRHQHSVQYRYATLRVLEEC
uniref:Ribonuclease P/MRP protein subunit POP1 n=1 Tax=Rhipicephalus zambeziensis TaxID=60191 RepID=A0A224Z6U3_9ACAR